MDGYWGDAVGFDFAGSADDRRPGSAQISARSSAELAAFSASFPLVARVCPVVEVVGCCSLVEEGYQSSDPLHLPRYCFSVVLDDSDYSSHFCCCLAVDWAPASLQCRHHLLAKSSLDPGGFRRGILFSASVGDLF